MSALLSPDFSNHHHHHHHHHRVLQCEPPDYTSPPLANALAATPEAFRDDDVIDAMRELAAAGNCTATSCHIPFEPMMIGGEEEEEEEEEEGNGSTSSSVGVIFYGGGLVDPRAYSVLAQPISERYGFTVVIPVFAGDLAFSFGACATGRFEFAKEAYPDIEQWLLMGHSFGGLAVVADAWTHLDDPALGGVVLLAGADVPPTICPGTFIDFSSTELPIAQVLATEDIILNLTRVEENMPYLSNNNTLSVIIEGGNHGQFGSYNDTLRLPILNQTDGEATIPPREQWEITIETAYQVALEFINEPPLSPGESPSTPLSPTPVPSSSEDIASRGNMARAWGGMAALWIPAVVLLN